MTKDERNLKSASGKYLNVFEDSPHGGGLDVFVIFNEACDIDDTKMIRADEIVREHIERNGGVNRRELMFALYEVAPYGTQIIVAV